MHITNKISQQFHKFANKEFSKPIQSFINRSYVDLLGLDMSEFDDPTNYKTLNSLFTRELKKQRKIDDDKSVFISPTDSFVTQSGDIKDTTALQIKGMSYDVNTLLSSYANYREKIIDGKYMNFYLSPKDYHRYHMIYDCKVTKLIHIPGKLYPVNFRYLNKQENLFLENERVVLECLVDDKVFYMVFVGALNVGKMVFNFEPKVHTNSDTRSIVSYEYDDLYIKKGDCLGYFMMGSTVLVFWEENFVELEDLNNHKVRFTERIAKII